MYNDGNWLGNLYTFDDRVSTQVGDGSTHTTIGTCLHSGKLTDHCDNCRYTECNARLIVDQEEHKKYMGFCSEECFQKACETLLIKDVSWDRINFHKRASTYKELRSLVKNNRIELHAVKEVVEKHLKKHLGPAVFIHKTSQKEGVIQMD